MWACGLPPQAHNALMLKTTDMHWLAGILEGEGCFRQTSPSRSGGRTTELTLAMTDVDVIERARTLLCPAKRITIAHRTTASGRQNKPVYMIRPTGSIAAGWMMTLYPLMGDRRRAAIRETLAAWRSMPVINKLKTACKYGHAFDSKNTYQYRPNHRMCRECARRRRRAYEARGSRLCA